MAFALGQRGGRRRAAFWICGVTLFLYWNVAVVLGALAGTALTNTDALGLDAVFPAVLLALVTPALSERGTRDAVLLGAALAVATAPFLPAGLPVLLAPAGVVVAVRPVPAPSEVPTSEAR